jgi:hypothetical protein
MIARPAIIAVAAALAAIASALAACGNDLPGPPVDDPEVSDDDPLAVGEPPPAGSLDDLHRRIIAPRCSGQPGLCHNGQFEPNLSTPAMAYAYLVGRPGLEKPDALRVHPRDPGRSLLIDKLRNRGVATQMPLGAEPLAEADVAALEAWIAGGALRAPGAAPAPMLDNPPRRPEVAIFDAGGTRLDGAAMIQVTAGTTLVLRHSVQDFETPDPSIPFAAVVLSVADGRNVVLEPAAADPHVGRTTFDATGPASRGDRLNYRRSWTIGENLTLFDPRTRIRTDVSAHGQVVGVAAIYIDNGTPAIVALDASATRIDIP